MPVAPLVPPQMALQDLSPQAASEFLYFAHFGDGIGQIFSQIFLFNLGAVETTAHLILRDDKGQLLSVDLNGELVKGETQVVIPPSGLRILRTDGVGPIAAGAVTVEATEPLAGVILFGGSVGFAGVGRRLPLDDGFLAPLRADSETSTDTGIAVMNLEGRPLELELLLLSTDGELVATGHLDEPLPPFGHRGFYPAQAIWDAPVDFSEFEGLCEVTASGRLADRPVDPCRTVRYPARDRLAAARKLHGRKVKS